MRINGPLHYYINKQLTTLDLLYHQEIANLLKPYILSELGTACLMKVPKIQYHKRIK